MAVLMHISLMANDAEHSFHVIFSDICISSVEKCLFKPFAQFSNILMIFYINGIRPHLLFRLAPLPPPGSMPRRPFPGPYTTDYC